MQIIPLLLRLRIPFRQASVFLFRHCQKPRRSRLLSGHNACLCAFNCGLNPPPVPCRQVFEPCFHGGYLDSFFRLFCYQNRTCTPKPGKVPLFYTVGSKHNFQSRTRQGNSVIKFRKLFLMMFSHQSFCHPDKRNICSSASSLIRHMAHPHPPSHFSDSGRK